SRWLRQRAPGRRARRRQLLQRRRPAGDHRFPVPRHSDYREPARRGLDQVPLHERRARHERSIPHARLSRRAPGLPEGSRSVRDQSPRGGRHRAAGDARRYRRGLGRQPDGRPCDWGLLPGRGRLRWDSHDVRGLRWHPLRSWNGAVRGGLPVAPCPLSTRRAASRQAPVDRADAPAASHHAEPPMTNGVVECFRCHTPIPESSKFCSTCGADVSGGDGPTSTSNVDLVRERLQRIIEGKYRIERLLGKGGMGQVFLAHDLTLEREVAIKVLPPDVSQDEQVVRRFQQEAKTAAKLDHPNIIPIYRVESEGGLNYFVMKYISGTSLEDLLDKKEPLPVPEIQRILWEAGCALGHAHQRGVVHRDVKPANIMFDHDGR